MYFEARLNLFAPLKIGCEEMYDDQLINFTIITDAINEVEARGQILETILSSPTYIYRSYDKNSIADAIEVIKLTTWHATSTPVIKNFIAPTHYKLKKIFFQNIKYSSS